MQDAVKYVYTVTVDGVEVTGCIPVPVGVSYTELQKLSLADAKIRTSRRCSMSEWINVETQNPEAEKEVRLFCVTASGYEYQCQGFYEPPGVYREDSDYNWNWECCDKYDEERDDYMVNPGWYEVIHNWDEYAACGIADKVTHWMPLPEPPEGVNKEDKNE